METFKELTGSIREYLRDRTSNPIYGAFILAWLGVNFRLVLVLFGEGTSSEKLRHIDERLYPSQSDWAWQGFGLPLVIAVLLVLVSPFIRRWVTVFLRQREKETVTRLLQIEEETPLTREQADVLRNALLNERARRLKEREELNLRIDELEKQLDVAAAARPSGLHTYPTPDADVSNPIIPQDGDKLALRESDFVGVRQDVQIRLAQRGLTRAQAEVLYLLRNGTVLTLAELAKKLGLNEHHPAKLLVDQLSGLKLISVEASAGGMVYVITPAGTQALAAVASRGFNVEASLARRAAS